MGRIEYILASDTFRVEESSVTLLQQKIRQVANHTSPLHNEVVGLGGSGSNMQRNASRRHATDAHMFALGPDNRQQIFLNRIGFSSQESKDTTMVPKPPA